MSQPDLEPEDICDMSHLVTEDEKPVDNRFSERQQRLLPHILFTSWEEGKPFEALSDVGLFYSLHDEPPVVPDFMLSLGVHPRPVTPEKANRSYMTWIYGKPPDLVIEVVSNRVGEELGHKLEIYAKVRVTYYVVFDPFLMLGDRELRAFRLVEGRYIEMVPPTQFPEIGLGLVLWNGCIEDVESRWLRFTDSQGNLLLNGQELAERAQAKAEEAEAKAEEAEAKAEEAEAKAEQAEKELVSKQEQLASILAESKRLKQRLRELERPQ